MRDVTSADLAGYVSRVTILSRMMDNRKFGQVRVELVTHACGPDSSTPSAHFEIIICGEKQGQTIELSTAIRIFNNADRIHSEFNLGNAKDITPVQMSINYGDR